MATANPGLGDAAGLYYRPSGKVTISGIMMALASGLVVAVVCAFAYAYLVLYVPFIYLNAIASVGFGMLVGAAAAWAAKLGRVRSASISILLAFICGCVGLYLAWVVWVYGVMQRYGDADAQTLTLMELLQSPPLLWELVLAINNTGTWSLSKSSKDPVTGIFLTIIWSLEALAVLAFTFKGATTFARADMFCERCAQWCGPASSLGVFLPGDASDIRQRLESHDLQHLASLTPTDNALHFWAISLESCPVCSELHALTLDDRLTAVNKEGQSTSSKPIVRRLLLSADEAVWLTQAMAARLAPPPPPAQIEPELVNDDEAEAG